MPSGLSWIDAIDAPAAVVDGGGRTVRWNRVGRELFGREAGVGAILRGVEEDVDAAAVRVARGGVGATCEGVDARGRSWRVRVEPLGGSQALLVLGSLESAEALGGVGTVLRLAGGDAPLEGAQLHRHAPTEAVDEDEDEDDTSTSFTSSVIRGGAGPKPARLEVTLAEARLPSILVEDGRVVDANRAALEALGREGVDTVLDRPFTAFSPPTQADGRTTGDAWRALRARATGGSADARWSLEGPEGALTVWLSLSTVRAVGRDVALLTWHPVEAGSPEVEAAPAPSAHAPIPPVHAPTPLHTTRVPLDLEALEALEDDEDLEPTLVMTSPFAASSVDDDEVVSLDDEPEPPAPLPIPMPLAPGPDRLGLALARSIRPLLTHADLDEAFHKALGTLGAAVEADRCFLVVVDEADGAARTRRRWAWSAEGVARDPRERAADAPHGTIPTRWLRVLSTGGVLVGPIERFPPEEQARLAPYGVCSCAVVPIRSEGGLVGFLGIDACHEPRTWSPGELEMLRGLAEGFAGAFRRQAADVALRESRDRFEAALRGADLASWDVDVRSGALRDADGMDRVLGRPGDALPDSVEGFLAMVHPEDRPRCVEGSEALLRDPGARLDVEVRVAHEQGWRWVLLRGGVTSRDADGLPLRAHGTLLDIDERKRLVEEVRAAREAAERASEAKSRFLANMSHEVRTPLNAILGMATLLSGTALDGEQRAQLRTLTQAGEHLLDLLTQVLDISRIDAGTLPLTPDVFSLRDLLRDVRDRFRDAARDKGLRLDVEVSTRLPARVVGDRERLAQVLGHLVDNAVKFTEAGRVLVRANVPEADDPHRVLIEVRDTGVGIPREHLGSLFDAFSQADGSYTRRHGGSGVGLALSRRLVQLMGGQLHAESAEGIGSTFRLDVRFASEAPQTLPAEALEGLPDDLRILVVEDNVVNQKVAVGMLGRLGCEARVTESGAHAIASLDDGPPEVVLMDLQMPDMDGLETTRRIRQRLGSDTHPWIIALTAAAQAEDRQRSLASGMNDYLAKPVKLEELREALARAAKAVRAG